MSNLPNEFIDRETAKAMDYAPTSCAYVVRTKGGTGATEVEDLKAEIATTAGPFQLVHHENRRGHHTLTIWQPRRKRPPTPGSFDHGGAYAKTTRRNF